MNFAQGAHLRLAGNSPLNMLSESFSVFKLRMSPSSAGMVPLICTQSASKVLSRGTADSLCRCRRLATAVDHAS